MWVPGVQCVNVQFGGWLPTFWRNLLLLSYSRILGAVHHTAQHYIVRLESWNSYLLGLLGVVTVVWVGLRIFCIGSQKTRNL